MRNKPNIILIGMKGSGKTTIGNLLAQKLGYHQLELDQILEKEYEKKYSEKLSSREIFKKKGSENFRNLEHTALAQLIKNMQQSEPFVLSVGGGTILSENNQKLLLPLGIIIYLNVDRSILLQRIRAKGIPPFFPYQDNPKKSLDELLATRMPIYERLANINIPINQEFPKEIVADIVMKIENYEN